jgi:methylphosphotriester-DNA--protein-cysteine methyltransferase
VSLEFFAPKLASTTVSHRWSSIDKAADILRKEWVDLPTISALAKQVAINECCLKAGFRRRIGITIGEYVRNCAWKMHWH